MMECFSQAKQIILPSGLSDDLNWKEQELIGTKEPLVLWYLDFSFQTLRFSPCDSIILQSQILAMEHFSQTIWPSFRENTAGVVLYQGKTDFSAIFPKELWLEFFIQWRKQLGQDSLTQHEEYYYDLYATQLFAELMQRLLAILPETCPALLLLEEKEPLALLAQKFSLERFESFFLLNLEKKELSFLQQNACLGVCLPLDLHCTPKTLAKITSTLATLQEKKIAFRVIPESKLHHFWNGLDAILVFTETLSAQGKRQLLGFCATDGCVVIQGESLSLPYEISIEKFLQIF